MSLENKILSRAGWILTILFLVVVGNIIFYILGVSNLDKMAQSLTAVAADNAAKLSEAEAVAATLGENVGRISTGRNFMETLAQTTLQTRPERLVIVQEEVAKLLKDAGLATDTVGYTYEILPPQSDKAGWRHKYLKTTLQLAIAGSYPQVKTFIRSLQESPQFFIVENLAVTTTSQGTVVLHANLLVTTYFIATETDRAGV